MSPPTTPILDSATGHSNLDPLIGGWETPTYTDQSEWIYFDNALAPNGASASAHWTNEFGPNCEIYFTIQNYQHISDIRLLLRIRGEVIGPSNGANAYNYGARLELVSGGETGGTFTPRIGKAVAGVGGDISEGSNVTLVLGDSLMFRAIDTTLMVWHKPEEEAWALILSGEDSDITEPGHIGIYSDSTTARFINFGGGNVHPNEADDAPIGRAGRGAGW